MNFIGIDVSKQKLDCVLLRNNLPDKPLHKVVANSAEGILELLAFANKKANSAAAELFIIMEATGVYHEIAAEALFNAGCKLAVVNPAYTKNFAKALGTKTKNDKVDATVLARFGLMRHSELTLWQPTPQQYQQLKHLQSRKQVLEGDVRRERNRLEKLQATRSEVFVIQSVERTIKHFEDELALLNEAIETHIAANAELDRDRRLLQSIPGVGTVVSTLLLPVFQQNRFQSAPQAAAYLGLVPVEHQSGSSVRGRARLSKAGNAIVRAKLYMAAIVAAQYNPDIKALYQRLLTKGKSKMAALGACMRKMVHICFGVLKHQTEYFPKTA
jgi:transposase